MTSIHEIALQPKAGKSYWKNCHREWREEFIYFLLIDRFHDSRDRLPAGEGGRRKGYGRADQLQRTCGGTIRGIIKHLEYIHDLGCSAIWLSPLFENNPQAYHGYAIQNYLEVDQRFGTKADLEELVNKAHALNMRVFLDIVLHHSGDNWSYPGDLPYYYYDDAVFPFGTWRHEDRPIPMELCNPELYGRKGRIRNFDAIPETRDGDFSDLKAFVLDESPKSLWLQELLVKIHCYWIRECDVDGFRLDAVKHMSELAISRFCSSVREYAYKLGKKNFFLFGELVAHESMYDDYMGPKTPVAGEDKTIYYGLNSVLDFQLHRILPDVILGKASPERLIERYESLRHGAVDRGPFGEFLVTFIDNHDQVGQWPKHRFGKVANEKQIIAGIGFLLCALGSPCIYYGTEQGFDGNGEGDAFIRECMFNPDDTLCNSLDKSCDIYKNISGIANLRRKHRALRFGRMYIRQVSVNREHFHFPNCKECLLAFSRVLFDDELLVAYNISGSDTKMEFVQVDGNGEGLFEVVFGGEGMIPVERINDGFSCVKLELSPLQFVVLARSHREVRSNTAVL